MKWQDIWNGILDALLAESCHHASQCTIRTAPIQFKSMFIHNRLNRKTWWNGRLKYLETVQKKWKKLYTENDKSKLYNTGALVVWRRGFESVNLPGQWPDCTQAIPRFLSDCDLLAVSAVCFSISGWRRCYHDAILNHNKFWCSKKINPIVCTQCFMDSTRWSWNRIDVSQRYANNHFKRIYQEKKIVITPVLKYQYSRITTISQRSIQTNWKRKP